MTSLKKVWSSCWMSPLLDALPGVGPDLSGPIFIKE